MSDRERFLVLVDALRKAAGMTILVAVAFIVVAYLGAFVWLAWEVLS